ncbi:hypothetical protein BC832DRAFT_595979 [Gaertneriomyces semiglobifer]|nr:hypothetical protein BC832DRAFT_595979 [Gaertneriomyces semiglobifer]
MMFVVKFLVGLTALSSVVAQTSNTSQDCDAIPRLYTQCNIGFENGFSKNVPGLPHLLPYPSAELDDLFKSLASCLCEIRATYPTVESLPCEQISSIRERYDEFGDACKNNAYNNVLVLFRHSISRINDEPLRAPYLNADGALVSGGNVPLISKGSKVVDASSVIGALLVGAVAAAFSLA